MKKLSSLFIGLICLVMIFFLAGCENQEKQENVKTENKELPNEVANLEKQYSNIKKDDLKWEYNESSKTIIISGKGEMRDYLDDAPAWNDLSNEAEKVVIGDEITSVGAGAFLFFTELKEVKLGNSVECIGAKAFDNCTSLSTVNFPTTLKYVGGAAFNNDLLHSKNGFILPEGIIYVGNSAFRSAFKESFVSIPASLTTIDKEAFANCYVEEFRVDENNKNYASVDGILFDKNITTLINYPAQKSSKIFEVPETVKTIKKEAIEVTNTLEKIVIPKTTTTIEEQSIFWNYGLKFIDVDKDNANYMSVDGVLYSKDGKYLISYPIASENDEYTVLDSTQEIQAYSLSIAKNLKKIFVKDGVKSLNLGAIYLCDNLEELELPKSLEKIDEYALEFNDNLKLIKYGSTKSDWEKIKVEDKNSALQNSNLKIDYTTENK